MAIGPTGGDISPLLPELPPTLPDIPDADLLTEEEQAAGVGLDGEVNVALPENMGTGFTDNLAEMIPDEELDRIGQMIVDMVDADLESRKPWEERFTRGLELLGWKDFVWEDGNAPFDGAATVINPTLGIAQAQYIARAVEEIFPSTGPVKTVVMGAEDQAKRASADRVQNHMNYQLTLEDREYFKETRKMQGYLAIYGSAYRKAEHDPLTDSNILSFVKADDLILPYSATSLAKSPRVTHRYTMDGNDVKKCIKAKYFRDVDLPEPDDTDESDPLTRDMDRVDSKQPVKADEDRTFTFYATDLMLDLQGFEDKDEFGEETGIGLPYTVTLDKDSAKVMRIQRCWKEADELKRRRVRYAEYWFMPGFGVYGVGLIHMIGSLSEAATGALRALLDSAAFAAMQGGFKAKDANVKSGAIEIEPGVWKDVDMSAEDLQKAFFTPPFRDPPRALFELLGYLDSQMQKFASTTDLMVGDADNKAPVGTTLALIEQGQKVYSSIHKGCHASAGVEFEMLFDLNAEYIPQEGYPYAVPGFDRNVFRADYDESIVSVIPVSDPNIYSQTQRIAQNQALGQMAEKRPQMYRAYEVERRMCEALKIPSIEDVLIDPENYPVMDPVTENIAMATGRPVKAKDDENHEAHLAVHMAFAQHPQFGGLPQAQQIMGPAMMAHIAEHVALLYAKRQRELGIPVPPINLGRGPGEPISQEDPQGAEVIAQAAAAMVGQFMQQSGLGTPPQSQDQMLQAAAELKKTNSEAFATFAAGVKSLVDAGQSVQQGEAELAGLGQDQPQPPPGGQADGSAAPPAAGPSQ